MNRAYSLIALLLVTLWLPATEWCALQAAGLVPSPTLKDGSTCTCPPGDNCGKDGCQNLERNLAEPTAPNDLMIGAPQEAFWAFQMWLLPAARQISLVESAGRLSRDHNDACFALMRTWQFVLRAALEPRLPSLA